MSPLRIAMAQLNLLVGDVSGNADQIAAAARRAQVEINAHVVVFPELALTGYPPEDLLLRPGLRRRCEAALVDLCAQKFDIDIILGHPQWRDGKCYNAASLIRAGRIVATYCKRHLPNYGVFDEKRYFASGDAPCVVDLQGVRVGVTICEDMWATGPIEASVAAGARLIVNLNASPYHFNKSQERFEIAGKNARTNNVPIVYVNLVGGQDELVFDGESFVVDADGNVVQRAPAFTAGLFSIEFDTEEGAVPRLGAVAPLPSEEESVYRALVLGVRDYIEKNHFPGAVLGLSGGVDSALVLCLAVDAIGAQRVEAVLMPSRHTAAMSLEDAIAQARALGVRHSVIPVEPMFESFLTALTDKFRGTTPGLVQENLQARVRGMVLMAISNESGKIVLATGNKSEMAVGYATLYGDMVGGFAAIKDVPKTLVYRLAKYRNGVAAVIPRRVLERAPSAELAPNQKDTDSLPPYSVLDAILERYVERDVCPEEIVTEGFDAKVVYEVVAKVDRAEYKRRQAAPGVRITPRAFGRDRRYPITSGFGSAVGGDRR